MGVLHEPQGWIGFAPAYFGSVLALEGYRLFVPNSVPLVEQEYKQTGKCSLFVHPSCMCPRLAWMPFVSSAKLLVCEPGVSSPCNNQTWIWKGKDHYHLDQNHAAGINCNVGEPTEFIQHLSVTFLASLGGLKVHSSGGLVWQPSAVAVHNCPLNSSSGGLIRLMNTYSYVGSILYTCKEVYWCQLNRPLPHHELYVASTNPVISSFLAWAFAPK